MERRVNNKSVTPNTSDREEKNIERAKKKCKPLKALFKQIKYNIRLWKRKNHKKSNMSINGNLGAMNTSNNMLFIYFPKELSINV